MRCLRNQLLNCTLVLNLILNGLRLVEMLLNLPKDLERNLLTPDQIASQDYSRDRAKVVPRGSTSPAVRPRFKPLFSLDGNVTDSESYKTLAELARAANRWSQLKRNLPPDGGKRSSRN